MLKFDDILSTIFGPRHEEFSDALRERLLDLWMDGFEVGTDTPHTCGHFCPSSQGPVGPERCDACRVI